MSDPKFALLRELRYAERLARRTARMYRRMDTACILTVIGAGSLSLAMLANHHLPAALSIASGAVAALAAVVVLTVRPLEKGFTHRLQARKYAALDAASIHMALQDLRRECHAVQKITTRHIKPLHDIVCNDMMLEIGRPDLVLPLRIHQKLLCVVTQPRSQTQIPPGARLGFQG
jgi:hypothetical protein